MKTNATYAMKSKSSPLAAPLLWWRNQVTTTRYRVGALITCTVVGNPENGIVKVRPTANPEMTGIIPGSKYPAAWKIAGKPDVTAGDKLRCLVVEFTPSDPNRDGQPRLILDLRGALPNPFKGLAKQIGKVVSFEIMATCQTKGLLVKLIDRPDIVACIPPDDITVRDTDKIRRGFRYDAVIIDVNEDAQAIELSMREAMRRQAAHQRPTAR